MEFGSCLLGFDAGALLSPLGNQYLYIFVVSGGLSSCSSGLFLFSHRFSIRSSMIHCSQSSSMRTAWFNMEQLACSCHYKTCGCISLSKCSQCIKGLSEFLIKNECLPVTCASHYRQIDKFIHMCIYYHLGLTILFC